MLDTKVIILLHHIHFQMPTYFFPPQVCLVIIMKNFIAQVPVEDIGLITFQKIIQRMQNVWSLSRVMLYPLHPKIGVMDFLFDQYVTKNKFSIILAETF